MTGNHFADVLLAPHRNRNTPFLLLDDRRTVTYAEFIELTGRLAQALKVQGMGAGDRLLARFSKSPLNLALHFACIRSGMVLVPASPALAETELIALARSCGAIRILDARNVASLAELATRQDGNFDDCIRGPGDTAVVLLTSGTTGKPKACILTHGNLVSNAQALAGAWGMTERDVVFHALPIYHTHGLAISTNAALAAGSAIRFLTTDAATPVIEGIAKSTVIMGTPRLYADLAGSDLLTRHMAAGVRLFISGGSPLGLTLLQEFKRRYGHDILERHGMTEASVSVSNPLHGERRAGTVGLALPGIDLRIVDPASGEALPRGRLGSVEIRGPNVFAGYLDDDTATARVFRSDGYFITGDIGRLHEDGYLEIVARAGDLVVCGGELVDPREIERVIDNHPGVLEAAVINVRKSQTSAAVLAIVVRRPGQTITEQEILGALAAQLDAKKLPQCVRFLDQLPRTGTGKVSKQLLRDRFSVTATDHVASR
ncbi:MAG: AMP-binding protein [Pseudorhodoplanes sp.]|uniref:AMP-binding protein n=1 Tax=Pseudorhodoplanes sp. TaxID=1934341 RepID=UPI003D0C1631